MSPSVVLLAVAAIVLLALGSRYLIYAMAVLAEAEAREAARRGIPARALDAEGRGAARRASLKALAMPIVLLVGFLLVAGLGSVGLLSLLDEFDGARRYGPLVWRFMLYFGVIAWWLVVATVFLWYARTRALKE
ncbi:MAG: hypothetical protein H6923_06565 [Alphaproteobacteria bacterium]|nr:hypothetical protein [Alphaproteobacteria bacterium]